jgi:hypothetical protein
LRRHIPAGRDPYEFILALPYPGFDFAARIRELAISDSVLGHIESLLEFATDPFAGISSRERKELGPYADRRRPELLNRVELQGMGDRQLGMLLGRLGVAIGDALSPKRQAVAILESFADHRYFRGGYFAYKVLSLDIATDRIYDFADAQVMMQVGRAPTRAGLGCGRYGGSSRTC